MGLATVVTKQGEFVFENVRDYTTGDGYLAIIEETPGHHKMHLFNTYNVVKADVDISKEQIEMLQDRARKAHEAAMTRARIEAGNQGLVMPQ